MGSWAASLWVHLCYYEVNGWDSVFIYIYIALSNGSEVKMLTGQEMHCSISLVNFRSDADTFEYDPLSMPLFNCSADN